MIDGELTIWRRVVVKRHLAKCPPCADGVAFEIELRRVIALRCTDEVPPHLHSRIFQALGGEDPT